MHLLIVEDEQRVARFLENALKSEGYQISQCSSLPELKNLVEARQPIDLAIVDRLLGLEDSLTFIKEFRKSYQDTGIIILSALNTPEEKAIALDQGADDYVAKPYSLVELTARLRALQRRSSRKETTEIKKSFQLGDLTLDLLSQAAFIRGKKVDVSSKEFKVLLTLIRHPGQVFSKYHLLDSVWDTQLDLESNVVETTMRNIRRKLEENQCQTKILSKRNVGYWLEA